MSNGGRAMSVRSEWTKCSEGTVRSSEKMNSTGAAEPTAALVGITVAGRRDIDGLIEMCSCSNFDFQI